MGKKNAMWVIFFTVLIVICAVIILLITNFDKGKSAEIYVDDKLVEEIDDISSENLQFKIVKTDSGYNKICWQNGSIWVEEADCANQTCVNFGKLSVTGVSIICAPHKLVIKIV